MNRRFAYLSRIAATAALAHLLTMGGGNAAPLTATYSPRANPRIGSLYACVYDDSGILYAGTSGAVMEFDGSEWTQNAVPDAQLIRGMAIKEDRLYVGGRTQMGWFTLGESRAKTFVSLKDRIPEEAPPDFQIMSVHADDGGVTFFSSQRVLFHWDGTELRYFQVPGDGYAIAHGDSTKLYIQVQTSGLYVFDGEKIIMHSEAEPFVKDRMTAFLPMEDGSHLAAFFESGLFVVDPDGNPEAVDWPQAINDDDFRFIQGIHRSDGTFALGTINTGLALVGPEGQLMEHLSAPSALPDNRIYCLAESPDERLALFQASAATILEPSSPVRLYDERQGLPLSPISTFIRFHGKPLIVTTDQILHWQPEGIGPDGDPTEEVPFNGTGIRSVLPYKDALLFAAYAGVYRYDGTNEPQLQHALPAPCLDLAASPQYPDLLVVGTYAGVWLLRTDKPEWTTLAKLPRSGISHQFVFDAKGDLWMLDTAQSLTRWPLGSQLPEAHGEPDISQDLVSYGPDQGLPGSGARFILTLLDNTVWLSSSTGGLYRLDPGTDRFRLDETIAAQLGVPPDELTWLSQHDDPDILLARHRSEVGEQFWLGYLPDGSATRTGDIEWAPVEPRFLDALYGQTFQLIWDDMDRAAVFTSVGQILKLQPDVNISPKPAPGVRIRSIELLEGGEADLRTETPDLTLPYNECDIVLRYAAPMAPVGDQIQFQSRIDSIGEEWSEWSSIPFKEFPRLPAGDFSISIRARGTDGRIGPAATITGKISPPLYATSAALLVYLMLAVALLAGLYAWLTRALWKRNLRLQAEIDERRQMEAEAQGQAAAIRETLEALNTNPSFDGTLDSTLNAIAAQLHEESAAYWEKGEGTQRILHRLYPPDDDIPPGYVVDSWPEHPGETEYWAPLGELPGLLLFGKTGAQSILVIDLEHRGFGLGCITVHCKRTTPFAPHEVGLARTLALQVAVAWRLQDLAGNVERSATLNERNRLAQEIHDTLAQIFLAIRLQAQLGERTATNTTETIMKLASQGVEQARRSIHDLLPARVDKVGFQQALCEWTDALSEERDEQFSLSITPCLPKSDPAVEFALYRVVQESVQNTLKHAKADRVTITLDSLGDQLHLTVTDDGVGFDPDTVESSHDHFGLTTMRQRVARFGGEFTICSEMGKGTTVEVVVPFKPSPSG